MMRKWILNSHGIPVPCDDDEKWSRWFNDINNRRIEETKLENGYVISTVFLGIDHNFWGRGFPVLYETMLFDPKGEEADCIRATTELDSRLNHRKLIKKWSV